MLELIKGLLDGLMPEPVLLVSEWADEHRYLSSETSAAPGQWQTSRTPYLREIMDNLSSFKPVQKVIFQKGAQIGATEAGLNFVGYCIDTSPSPIMYVMPTVDVAKTTSKTRVDTMIEATPRLQAKIKTARSRESDNTIQQKGFPGGFLRMAGANSAAGLRSMPIKKLVLDEIDAYPLDLDEEGSPIDLALARTRTYNDRKIFMLSTPTVDETSVIQKELEKTSIRKYFVPCPFCGATQTIEFENLHYPEKVKPELLTAEDVKLKCVACSELIHERYKTKMLEHGSWVDTVPENINPITIGYFMSSLYSPYGWYSWTEAVCDFLNIKGDQTKNKTFMNTVLGLTWKGEGDSPQWEHIYNKREAYELNKPSKDVVFVTCGVDVQKDRLELEIVGWCRDMITYSIDYRVLSGKPTETKVWDDLAKIVGETWVREDGLILPMQLMCVDSGYETANVYKFCRRFDQKRVVPVKGREEQALMITPPSTVDVTFDGMKVGKIKLWHIGVSLIKSELYGFLKLQIGDDKIAPQGYCHFPQYGENYFRGIVAEQLEYKLNRGYKKYEWVKKYDRNEPLDCRNYARAAAAILGVDRFTEESWSAYESAYDRIDDHKPKPVVKKPFKSIWDK